MSVQVNRELCAGCGACVEVCPVEAIHLLDRWAEIDDALCTQCEACVSACPNEAITVLSTPVRNVPVAVQPVEAHRVITMPAQTGQPEIAASARGLVPLAGAALGYLGREIAPRLADALIAALERRLARPATTTTQAPLSISSSGLTQKSRGIRRQAHYRGGRNSKR